MFFDHEYRLYTGGGQVLVFDTIILNTWTVYDYFNDFGCGFVYEDQLYYGGITSDGASSPEVLDIPEWIIHLTHSEVHMKVSRTMGMLYPFVLKSKFFDFQEGAANKKRFKRMYFTIYSELVSYDIDLIVNTDNEEQTMTSVISSKISRWGQ